MNKIRINNKIIDNDSFPFIIAEAGINHNGEVDKALQMVSIAKKAGADAIKFQTFKASGIILDKSLTYTYRSQGKEIEESMYDMFERCEFLDDEWREIKQKCLKEDILFLSTPENQSDLELLLDLGIEAIKVGSDDFTNIPLLKEYSLTGLPLILSSGMSNLQEIKDTVNSIKKTNDNPLVLLICTSEYPTSAKNVNLLKFNTIHNFFEFPLGFSDHTQGSLASSLAVSFGACVFEKHFTLDQNLPGPDHWFSENPEGLKNWINDIKKSYLMMGNGNVEPTESEQKMKKLARKSIVILKDIKKNEILDIDKIGIKRPGNGLPPKMFEEIIGKKTTRDLIKNELLKKED